MKATTSIDTDDGITHNLAATGDMDGNGNPVPDKDARTGKNKGKPESELRAAARRHGLTMHGTGGPDGRLGPLSCPMLWDRDTDPGPRPCEQKVTAVLGEVPGQGVVYRQGGLHQR